MKIFYEKKNRANLYLDYRDLFKGYNLSVNDVSARKQINTQAIELTPKKQAAVAGFFEMWMQDKRKYPEQLIGDELKKLNKYLNGAITSARSALCPKKKKLLNIDEMQSHSKQSNITLSTINQENKTI